MTELVDRVAAAIEQRLKMYPITPGVLSGSVGWGASPRELAEAVMPLLNEAPHRRLGPVFDSTLIAARETLCAPYRCTEGHEYSLRPVVTRFHVDGRIEATWPNADPCPVWVEDQPCPGLIFPLQPLPAVRRDHSLRRFVRRGVRSVQASVRAW